MRNLIFICIFFASYTAFSQSESSLESIGFACGEGGVLSIAVQQMSELISMRDDKALRALIYSTDPSLKYLSIKVCEYKVKKKKLVLTIQEKMTIESAKQSEEKIAYCSGCTLHEEYSLKELFNNDRLALNKEFNAWIKNLEK